MPMRQLVLISVLLWIGATAPALADKRVALVIGNSTYQNVPALDNPRNDAKLIADTLKSVGFTLVGGGAQTDLDKAALDKAVQSFSQQVQGADVALFYYAGHGVQVRGANYLVPVGANPTREADVDFQMVDIAVVLRQMESAGTKLNIVILDACRNNPFGGRGLRGTDSGLAQMRAPEGTLISYATQPGNVALDGADGNSPFTKALAQTIQQPGLGIFEAFNAVGLTVMQTTGNAQQPWLSTSPIRGDFYFSGTAPAKSSAPAAPSSGDAERAWAVTQNTSSIAVLEEFVRQFGNTVYGNLARARLEELKKNQLAVVAPPSAPAATSPCNDRSIGVSMSGRQPCPLSVDEEHSLKLGTTFKECEACPELVVVPAGSFAMGSPGSERERDATEGPQHEVTFAHQFAVGKFAVTFDEWDACVAGGGCAGYKPSDDNWGRGRRPVINVSYNDIRAYLTWLSRKTGRNYRLLSEAEHEYVARAGTTSPFWFGTNITTKQANYNGAARTSYGPPGDNLQKTVPVDWFEPNPFGLYQVVGNSWDWLDDCHHDNYRGAPTDGSAWLTGDCNRRELRGGGWASEAKYLRSAARGWFKSETRYNDSGLRVARTLLAP